MSAEDGPVRTVTVPAEDPRLRALVDAQVGELATRYADSPDHGFAQPPLHPGTVWLLLLRGDLPIGCAALQPLTHTLPTADADVGEVKRLYVVPAERGRGMSRRLMTAVEQSARTAGYLAVQLETGLRQPEAVALYRGAGYQQIPAYGHYRTSAQSICFRKTLTP